MKSKHLLLMLLLALLAPWAANAQSPLFSEDFESGSMPTGWTTDGSGSWSVSTGDYYSSTGAGQGSYNAKIAHGTSGDATKLITPEIDLSSVASAELSFMHVQRSWSGDIDGLKVYYRTSSSGTWTLLEEYTSAYASWTTEEGIVLPNLSSTYQVAFEYIDHYGYGLGVDNVIITQGASCDKPSTLTATAPYGYDAAHCILLEWEGGSGSYNVQLKKASESEEQWQTKAGGVSLLSMLFNDLDPLTTYNARVQSVCGGEVSGWRSVTFTTAAGIPLNETFGTAIPTGWAQYSGLLSDVMGGTALTSGSGWAFGQNAGVFDDHARTNIYGTTCKHWLVMPTFHMEDNVQLLFDLAYTKYVYSGTAGNPDQTGGDDKFVVLITTDNMATWTILRQWDNAGSEYVLNDLTPTPITVAFDLSSYAGQNIAIAFYAESTVSNADNNLHIDNVSIDYIPNCAKPTGLAKSDVTAHEATITWTSDASAWQICVNDDEENLIDVTTNSYQLTDLDAETPYSVKVRANCGGTNSEWTNAVSFTTGIACYAPTAISVSEIEGHSAVVGWTEHTSGTATQWNVTYKKGTDDDAVYDDNMVLVTTKPYTLTGLDPQTAYIVKVRAVCGGIDGNSTWITKNFTTDVACSAPAGLAATLTPGNGSVATLSWTSSAADFVLEYGTASDFTGATSVNVSGNSKDLTGLTPETQYYARVKADCSAAGDGMSEWSSTLTFTPTDAYTITVNDGTNTNSVVPVYGTWVDNYSYSQFIIPAADLAAMQWGVINELTFYSSKDNAPWTNAMFEVYVTETTGTTLSALADWSTMDKVMNESHLEISGNQMVVTLDAPYQYMGGNLMIGVKQTVSGTYTGASFYGITAASGSSMGGYGTSVNPQSFLPKTTFAYTPGVEPSCNKPSGLTVTYTGGTTATVSWTSEATAWNMRVNGVDVNGVITNPYTLTGLDLATTYSVEVQADCGANGTSDWTNAVSFTTDLCQSENMCAINYSFTDQYNDSWNNAYMNIVDALTGEVLYQLTMPNVAGPYEGSFNVCDGRDIQFVWVSGNYPNECGYVFTDINDEVILEKATGTTAPAAGVVITHTVDCTIPTCAKPTAFAATNPGPYSIDLSWTENGTATQWQICVNDGVDDNITLISNTTSGVTISGQNVSYTLTGLDPETDYTVKVRAYCNATDQSNWSNEESFTTTVACPAPTNLNASASGADITVSWDGFASTYNIDINGTVTNNVTSPYTFTGELATEYEVKVQANCSGTTSEWTSVVSITTDLCLPANQCELTFELTDAWGDGWNGAYIDVIDVLTNTSLGHLANENLNGTQGSGENELNTKTLAVCDGREIQFVWNTGSYDSEASYVVTDVNGEEIFSGSGAMSAPVNYTVSCAPLTCPKPTDLTAGTLDGHSVDLSWTENGTATQWQICVNGDETQPVTANTNPFTLTGLDPETGYTVKVRAYCDATDQSAWSSEISFITDVACPAPTNLDATNITAQTATLEWNGTAAGEYEVRYAEGEAMQELYHNDGAYSTVIGLGGGEFEWGVMFPAGTYTENKLTKVSVYDQSAMTGTVNIYNDGATEPDATALVATKVIEFTGAEDWIDITFNDVTIDPTQNVWIIFDNVSGAGYPAAACADAAGDVNGRWVGLSGTWSDLANAGMSGYAWMIRAIVEDYDDYGSSVTTTDETYTLTNLTPATTYTAQVRAICGGTDGESAWVSTVFTTETFTMTKNIVANSWYALSSPVNTPNVTDVTNLTDGDYDFYRYNEVTSTWENYKAHRSSNFTTFENGRGYIYRNSTGNDLTFTGVPNTATDYPYLLTAEGSGDLAGFNLLGNPFATDYNYSGVCYNLTEKGTWKVNATGYDIPVCEAILIKVESETPCSFTSSKSAPKAAEALAFTVKGNGYEDVTYAMLEEGEGLNKVAHLADEAPALSIPVDGSNYAIAYLGYEVESFPLTLNATAGEYTIALNNQISGLSYCHLLDKVTGKETDLLKGAYTFKANGNSDRFTVLLNASLENGEIAIWNGNSWIVNGEGTLQVFDVMGRRVYNQEVAGQSSLNTDELATGVYVIRLGEKSQKIVVK